MAAHDTPIPPIDYSSYYASIATALGTIATNSTEIKNSLAIIATQTTALANTLGTIEGHQQKLRQLGEGAGIHVVGAYDAVQFITTYRTLIEEGKLLSYRDKVPSAKEVDKALNDLGDYISKIKQNIPVDF